MKFRAFLIIAITGCLVLNISPVVSHASPLQTYTNALEKDISTVLNSIENKINAISDISIQSRQDILSIKNLENQLALDIHKYNELKRKFEPFQNEPRYLDLKEIPNKHKQILDYYSKFPKDYNFIQEVNALEQSYANDRQLKENYDKLRNLVVKERRLRLQINDLNSKPNLSEADKGNLQDLLKEYSGTKQIISSTQQSLSNSRNTRVYNPQVMIAIDKLSYLHTELNNAPSNADSKAYAQAHFEQRKAQSLAFEARETKATNEFMKRYEAQKRLQKERYQQNSQNNREKMSAKAKVAIGGGVLATVAIIGGLAYAANNK